MVKPVGNDTMEERLEDRSAQVGASPFAPVCQTSDLITPDLLTDQLESQPAVMAWKQLLSERWEVAAIEMLTRRKRRSSPVYRLRGPHGETVVAKRRRKEVVQVERIIYQ